MRAHAVLGHPSCGFSNASALESIQEGWFTVRRSGPHDPTIPFPIDVTHLIGRYDHLLRIVHKT